MRICVYISLFGLSVRLHCHCYNPVLLCLRPCLLSLHKNTRTVLALRLILASSLENWRYRKTRNVLTRNRRSLFLFHLFRGLSVAAARPFAPPHRRHNLEPKKRQRTSLETVYCCFEPEKRTIESPWTSKRCHVTFFSWFFVSVEGKLKRHVRMRGERGTWEDDDQVCVVSGGNARCCPRGTKFGTLLVKLITAKDTYL